MNGLLRISLSRALVLTCLLAGPACPCSGMSIIVRGFSTPLVHRGSAYLLHVRTHTLICLDLADKSVRWRRQLEDSGTLSVSSNGEILVTTRRELLVLDAETGSTLRRQGDPGPDNMQEMLWATDVDGRLFFRSVSGGRIRCIDRREGLVLWEYRENRVSQLEVVGRFAFVGWQPFEMKSEEDELYVLQGPTRVVCLDARNGAAKWQTDYGTVFRRKAKEVQSPDDLKPIDRIHVSASRASIACAVGRDLHLLDREAGTPTGKFAVSATIRGLSWWGESALVLALADDAASEMQIQVVRPGRSETSPPLTISLRAGARGDVPLSVIGNVLVIDSSESVAVDLTQCRELWRGPWRSHIVSDGTLYCNSSTWRDSGTSDEATFGTCDPRTGRVTVLYSEVFE